jgi:hypothetical protein
MMRRTLERTLVAMSRREGGAGGGEGAGERGRLGSVLERLEKRERGKLWKVVLGWEWD